MTHNVKSYSVAVGLSFDSKLLTGLSHLSELCDLICFDFLYFLPVEMKFDGKDGAR